MALAAILLAHPVLILLLVLIYSLDAVIGAATIDDDVFKVRVVLFEDRKDSLFQVLPLVEGGGDYSYLG